MRVLVLCPHYAPDAAPTGAVMTAIADGWKAAGHEVDIVTALPWYMHHAVEPEWAGRLSRTERGPDGVITRVHPFPTDKRNIPARAAAFGGFTALATVAGIVRRRRPDVVMAMSPPLTLGVAGWLAARVHRVPVVFNVQDVFPDVAVEVGAIKNKQVVRVLEWLERFVYKRSNAVTVLSDDLRDNVNQKLEGHSGTEVRVIPNFVDTKRIYPGDRHNSYRDEYMLGDKTVVMYAGNIGFSQPLNLLIDAARALKDRDDLVFVINGGGSGRPGLEHAAADLENVVFADLQPAERLPEVLAAADVHVVALRRGLARSSVPSKLYSILAAARPVLASIDADSEVERVIERAKAGVAVEPENSKAFLDAVLELVDDPAAARKMGESGRAFVETWASPQAVADAYIALFVDLGA